VNEVLRPPGRIHVIGAGPVGLFLTALLQSVADQRLRVYERRADYTRTRMVSLAKYLVADSVESYNDDAIDGLDMEAIFDPVEIATRLAYRRTVAPDLRALLDEWSQGFVALNTIENELSELIETRATGTVERVVGAVGADEALAMGLVDEVVAADAVYDAALRWASQFAGGPAFALRAAKEAIDAGLGVDLETGLAIERQAFAALFATEDQKIGTESFVANGPGKAPFVGR
jgi:threonine dehydrogenase-like Zn-dependent dehydrogenase